MILNENLSLNEQIKLFRQKYKPLQAQVRTDISKFKMSGVMVLNDWWLENINVKSIWRHDLKHTHRRLCFEIPSLAFDMAILTLSI